MLTGFGSSVARRKIRLSRRVWRSVAVTLAIVGILFHAALPIVHPAAAAGYPSRSDDTILLCTATGFQLLHLVDVGTDGDNPLPANDPVSTYYCPICLGSKMAGTALLPPTTARQLPTTTQRASFSVRHATPIVAGPSSTHPPRAPPVIA